MQDQEQSQLPGCATAFIDQLVTRIRYRKKVRQEVKEELITHFQDELSQCTDPQHRQQTAQELICEFGDPTLLARLIRRAKKRCRPLWLKAAIYGLQGLGICILYLLICILPLAIGNPTIRINYLDHINNLVKASPDESLNARPYYKKAVEAMAGCPGMPEVLLDLSSRTWPGDMSDVQRIALADYLARSGDALEALRQAASKPCYWVEYRVEPDPPLGFSWLSSGILDDVSKDLASYRDLARRMLMASHWAAYNGDVNGAMDDALVLVRFGRHLQDKGTLAEQLQGTAIESGAKGCICTILRHTQAPAPTIKKTRQILDQYWTSNQVFDLDIEKAFHYDLVQRFFTDDGKGNGRLLRRGLILAATSRHWGALGKVLTFHLPDRKTVVKQIDAFFEAFEDLSRMAPFSLQFETQLHAARQLGQDNLFLMLAAPAYERLWQLTWRSNTSRRALTTVLVLMEYRQDRGHYPQDLDELVKAGYLEAVPIDLYSGSAFGYRPTQGDFLLYSVGQDLKDDEGVPGTDDQGRPIMFADHGDWVFWPWIG